MADAADMSDAVLMLARSYTLKRSAAGVLGADGIYRENVATSSTIQGVRTPLSGRQMDQLPEGIKSKEVEYFYSVAQLFGAAAPDGRPADRLIDGADEFEVHAVEPWGRLGNFYRSMIVRVGQ